MRPRRAALRAVRDHASAVAGLAGAAPARRGRGDRPRVAGQGARRRAPLDRGQAGPAAWDRARLAARVFPTGAGARELRQALDARDRRARARRAPSACRVAVRRSGRCARRRGEGLPAWPRGSNGTGTYAEPTLKPGNHQRRAPSRLAGFVARAGQQSARRPITCIAGRKREVPPHGRAPLLLVVCHGGAARSCGAAASA